MEFRFRQLGCGDECVGCVYLYIRGDADSFPVRLSVGIDRFLLGNAHAEVIVDAMKDAGVSAASGSFADERGAFQHLQVVARNCSAPDHVVRDVRIYTGLSASLFPGTGECVHESVVGAPRGLYMYTGWSNR